MGSELSRPPSWRRLGHAPSPAFRGRGRGPRSGRVRVCSNESARPSPPTASRRAPPLPRKAGEEHGGFKPAEDHNLIADDNGFVTPGTSVTPYIVDFVCLDQRLIIEADGSHHADDKDDARRDAFLVRQDFRILRLWNNQVMRETDDVAAAIFAALSVPHPPKPSAWAPPSPVKGEGFGASNG
ncbi:MAG TPA: DUF559 domain-containing protein [Allosphingosinicella sp.]